MKPMPVKVQVNVVFRSIENRFNANISALQGMVKRPSQQGQRGDQSGGQRDGPPQRREIKLPSSSLVRVERVEDPNVWKPKHAAVKPKEEDADKSSLEVHFHAWSSKTKVSKFTRFSVCRKCQKLCVVFWISWHRPSLISCWWGSKP